MSDHTPLLLQGELHHHHNIWSRPAVSAIPMKRLHIKMARVAKGIKRQKKEKIGDTNR
jgi:hypothetical protein